MTLRALRTNYSLTAKEVAEEIGIHHQTLLKYEHDSTRIPVNLLRKLSDFYEVDPDFIFFREKIRIKSNKHLSAG